MAKWPYNTAAWQQLRRWRLAQNPLCQCPICAAGAPLLADTVDHIRPHRGDPDLAFDPANTQSLAKTHHDRFKQSAERGGQGFARGCDADGNPVAPGEHWR